ncbi:hypothetical protein PtrSN002B_004346 [Pyrenophora tritici-repentis]|uniref:Uncharacterized protein n=2 Tax=Pyrenophora tritici-repentis TaxID=45151 RepID=A0A2W1EEJ4_9PLEO|nr:uncharacterized protein PTRG_00872 [Pyrenophora tritici-repentis Pt-1C-BFP]KAA8625500.1 hypothetical protein PtrV1_01180 [Pyrenophora tritici-repentis]EDU40310.1 conserved hypothetical protein [Pyrenophora tritici-repentis Pt-1C-BFP]KAF7453904.1 hypothetical protein A1F99_011620 [Pyrenophora tritici-repentis]KAF7576993.1 hypothetical protein PtrM4_012330 [Pyrenophora tritici-repentis]KAG9387659.1 hypothetical protein A1F94_000551 [Pyrenophora tritici-repentis]
MASASGSVFGETLHTITTTKLEELAKQRVAFEEEYSALLDSIKAEPDPLKRVGLLLDGSKICLGIRTDNKGTKDGRTSRVIINRSRNIRLETDIRNLDRFIEQARFDPSVSLKVIADWEKTLLQYLSVQSTKFQYADLYGKLVTEWLSSDKTTGGDADVEMTGSFEEIPGAKKLASRVEWEKDVFQAAGVDEQELHSYLQELFVVNKKAGTAAIRDLRQKVVEFENNFNDSAQFNQFTLREAIQGLQNSDLLSNEKRETLRDFLSNDVILLELCDILNIRMTALGRWTWGAEVLLEERRKINGEFSIHFDSDLLQAIFLHHIGVKWSVFFKSAFSAMHKHEAWTRNATEIPKTDRIRRSYFLGDQGTKVAASLEQRRKSRHHARYFAHQLLDFETQQIETEEGEEEAEYGDYVVKKRRMAGQAPAIAMVSSMPGRPKQTARKSTGGKAPRKQLASRAMRYSAQEDLHLHEDIGTDEDEEDEDDEDEEYDYEDDMYRHESKKPMEAKQSLLHLLSTEVIVNTRLHGELTCFRTIFDSWNSLLPHETILTVLSFLGISDRWTKFFARYLHAPLKFADDPSSEPRLRRRGMPGSHTLSDTLGETVLFCLDFAVNQATHGVDLYRIGDDVWFWNKDYDTCTNAWASVLNFTEIMGVKLDEKKTGSMRISHIDEKTIDDRLPEGEIRWGFLQLDPKSGRFEIDQKMVDGHVEELRTQLQGKSKSVIDYIQAWNSYAATFFSSNFGKAANCFGREHVDKMLATHRHIQDSIFPKSSIVQHLKDMIEQRFSVKGVPDGFLFFPVELGGLELKSPFVGLLQTRESVEEDPFQLIDRYKEDERDDYNAAKRIFDRGTRANKHRIEDTNWKPSDSEAFFSFEEFTKYREAFASVGKANLVSTYKELLKLPREKPIDASADVQFALARLSGNTNLRGILTHWGSMEAYWKWIAQMYGPEMINMFGGLNAVDFGLLPIGMVSMFRQRRTKWQG